MMRADPLAGGAGRQAPVCRDESVWVWVMYGMVTVGGRLVCSGRPYRPSWSLIRRQCVPRAERARGTVSQPGRAGRSGTAIRRDGEIGTTHYRPPHQDTCPGRIFPNCMLLIVIPFPPANQRVWRVRRRETRTVDEGVSYVRLLTTPF